MNGGLPTSLRLNRPRGLTYSPYPTSTLEEILGGAGTLAGTAEQIRRQKRQAEIVKAILGGEEIPAREAPERAKSTLGKILQVIGAPFDPRRPPMGPVPLEQTIAEVMLKRKLEPKTVKEQLGEKFLAEGKEALTPEQLKLIGAHIPPEKESEDWEVIKGDKHYWRINPETGETKETKIAVATKEKEPTTVEDAWNIVKTYAGYPDTGKNSLEKMGVLGLIKAARNIIKSQPEYAQRIAADVDAYFDEMLEKYNGNYEKARAKTIKYMETLGVAENIIRPYLRDRPEG